MDRIAEAFRQAGKEGRAALMPYVTGGFPRLDMLADVVDAAFRGGADLVEVGVPFSDPLADGPVLQRAAEAALAGPYSLQGLFDALAARREPGPVVLLTYVNPVLAWGAARFLAASRAAGASGLIIPDLPWAESREMDRAARGEGLALIPLAAPTSTDEHLARLNRARGFVYGVSLTGVTGARADLDPGLAAFAGRLKRATRLPVAIGFGISTPEQARTVGRLVDGVIVGSALVRAQADDPADAVGITEGFVRRFRDALDGGRKSEGVGVG